MSELMRAAEIRIPGGPEALVVSGRPQPMVGPHEVLIAVEAAGVNRADVLQREGRYPPPPGVTDIPGLEVAGRVFEVGPLVTKVRQGERVCALVSGGGYADYAAVHEGAVLPLPRGLSMVQAAALPEACFTVWTNVFERGQLAEGETLLVHGGTSGIGVTAIQMAKAFGAQVIATAGTAEKCAACLQLGADLAINYNERDFVEEVKAFTGGRGAHVILDMVGGDYLPRNVKAAARDGRIVNIAYQAGSRMEFDFLPVMLKRLTITGSTLRIRSDEDKAGIAEALREYVWPLVESGHLRPVVDSVFPLERAADAHRRMESSQHVGKIVLEI
ncbi:NAD(P)H-quinone oxidoreductase [Neomegalonema perideroedes]|uniref:NAD(P)H-quinone oxidoreductase n=1 Tax=Neomegalonema perideroedes TaxID=217219 RepID=UPI000375E9CD|nr:NAD(P)H-quinone oxidoreductase [Neomegalonema perideroedes]